MSPLKMYFLLKMGIFQCHVSFQGCFWGFPKMVVITQQTHGFFLLKMINLWGVKWGNPPFKENVRNLLGQKYC